VFDVEGTRGRRSGDAVVAFLKRSGVTLTPLSSTNSGALHDAQVGCVLSSACKGGRVHLHMLWQVALASFGGDVLVFPDLGLDTLAYLLAFGRFAPVQCAFWAMPTTSGHQNVDYYLVGESFLDDVGEWWGAQYSEQVVMLDRLGSYLFRPEFPPLPVGVAAQRQALYKATGRMIPPHVPIFLCPQVCCWCGGNARPV